MFLMQISTVVFTGQYIWHEQSHRKYIFYFDVDNLFQRTFFFHLRIQEEVTVGWFSVSSCSSNLLDIALKALTKIINRINY